MKKNKSSFATSYCRVNNVTLELEGYDPETGQVIPEQEEKHVPVPGEDNQPVQSAPVEKEFQTSSWRINNVTWEMEQFDPETGQVIPEEKQTPIPGEDSQPLQSMPAKKEPSMHRLIGGSKTGKSVESNPVPKAAPSAWLNKSGRD